MQKVLIIDDDRIFLKIISDYIKGRYPALDIIVCDDPLKGLVAISNDLDLLLVDFEMPGIDGGKILSYATEKGVCKNRIIILSGRDAGYLHERFPLGKCLAVLNKYEARQKEVLDMIFRSLQENDESECII